MTSPYSSCQLFTVNELAINLSKQDLITRTKFADKFQADLDNYVAAHKLEWSEADEAVRDTMYTVINELRGDA